jgi:5-methylcytosine-specific restriction endonuclease McrA
MTRRRFSLKDKLEVLVRQGRCPLCGERLGSLDGLQWDHVVPLAMGGADEPDNLQAIHIDCHGTKTHGTPATTAGSDIHRIAKTKRIARDPSGGEEFRRRLLARVTDPEPVTTKSRWPKRSFRRREP